MHPRDNDPPPPHRPGLADALDGLGAGVLVLDGGGRVALANPQAVAFFAPIQPVGLDLRSLFGLSGASGGSAVAAAAGAGTPGAPSRLGLPGGQVLDSRCQPLPCGGAVITLFDVTGYVHDAELAARDPLTGLTNRRGLQAELSRQLGPGMAGAVPLSVISLDLDRFKEVNDTLGHAVGDALLVKVAERLRNATRGTDLVARLGGDEFVVLQSRPGQPGAAEALATRLVDLLGRTYVVLGHAVNIGASIGIARAPDDAAEPDILLQRADMALYRAKAEGRGTFRFFQDSMDVAMQARRQLEIDLRRAVALKQFDLAYQPQVDLPSSRLLGFEALLRWRDPVRGPVSPAEFIPLAEEIGLIAPIGEWVLRTACLQAAGWPAPLSIAVNISPVQFRGNRLVAVVGAALAASGLEPSRLELEITEGALMDSSAPVLEALHALRGMGVRISMDDFGTGYSSLSYLRKFPFDKIKIDQSFVRGADADAEAGAIIRAVAALGASLGMRTVAEGVETPQQLSRIQGAGCDAVQGYLTGRPMPAADAGALARQASHPLEPAESIA
ncbi:EAL domain-containing protein [Roseomonas haemaphysalidis]|uniref:EAL domain-containing protein n=1 Tax=Roseomonas haemaphysalidis TaxID=2768162 RepID=A0ABS3KXC9_9PROT|nr:EAL domain-containing protein [Roseomonas haemaphysalidis]MBO1081572.1 EAL domain-containing protein [Roseomonas haemaphysalidis]